MLAAQGLPKRPEPFGVDERHRPPAGGVSRAAAGVVRGGSPHGILRVAGVEGSVRTADDVHEVHGPNLGTAVS